MAPFPWIKVTGNDFAPQIRDPEPNGLDFEFIMNVVISEYLIAMALYSTFSMSLSLCLLIIGTVTVYPSFGPWGLF